MGKNKHLYTYKGPVIRFRNILDNKWSSETYAESPTKALSNITYKAKKAFKLTPDMKLTLDPKCLHKQETTTLDLPDPIGGARRDETFIFVVSLPYGQPETDFSLELICKDGVTCGAIDESGNVVGDNVAMLSKMQVMIDSTGMLYSIQSPLF